MEEYVPVYLYFIFKDKKRERYHKEIHKTGSVEDILKVLFEDEETSHLKKILDYDYEVYIQGAQLWETEKTLQEIESNSMLSIEEDCVIKIITQIEKPTSE